MSTTPKNTPGTNRTDAGIAYDDVHVTGDEDAIYEHECAHGGGCFLVDWRGEFEELFEDVNSRFSGSPVMPTDPEEGFVLSVSRDGKTASTKSFERVEVLQAMDQVLQGAPEEMRVITESLLSDTLCVLVKPAAWWTALEQQFPDEISKLYSPFKDIEPG